MRFKKINVLFFLFFCARLNAQQMNGGQLFNEIQKLPVCANVLYIAAHPDDENTRLLAYLANERKYRTGYLSLTRGDGGQNLIGNEQGVELGLIRTQELLAARRIDGAEQFFTSAFDFGFSKSSEEAFAIWNKEKILADVVWIIRKFRPDVIIARFPEDTRAGHGHHAASGILAREAFIAAADNTKFTEHFKYGLTPWKVKRVVWNSFNFGSNNTTNDSQLKVEVGAYNSLLGRSYGEIASSSRSQHKSQGFGVASQRGNSTEYFALVAGEAMQTDFMDGVNTTWSKFAKDENSKNVFAEIDATIQNIIAKYEITNPEKSVQELINLHKKINQQQISYNKEYMLGKLNNIIANCLGLYMEATSTVSNGVQGDSLKVNIAINSRLKDSVLLKNIFYRTMKFGTNTYLSKNKNWNFSKTIFIENNQAVTQPFWLANAMDKGSFNIKDQLKMGNADVDYETFQFVYEIDGQLISYPITLQYKYTDPVKGEIFQPLNIVPSSDIAIQPTVVLQTPKISNNYTVSITPKRNFENKDYFLMGDSKKCDTVYNDYVVKDSLLKGRVVNATVNSHTYSKPACGGTLEYNFANNNTHLRTIQYDHIPTINYLQKANVKFVQDAIVANKKTIGYIDGAGDKVVEALEQLGYKVDLLGRNDITLEKLKKYNAIVTGVRAYNTNAWMPEVYNILMEFIKNGGNLIVQYNTANQLGPLRSKIGPYPFNVVNKRITDETAKVNVINANEIVLNKPNKIIPSDYDNWVQERSVYEVDNVDAAYRKVFTMNDPKETALDGSLIIAAHGKGNFVYCSLALFRQLPAGVAGAYKLMANMVELPKNKVNGSKK